MPRKIILDCDPGHDDTVAMLLAHGDPRIEVLAVTTVGGNQTLEKVTRNALGVATIAGIRDVPIAAGCAGPFLGPLTVAAHVHGESGLGDVVLPDADVTLDPRHGVDVIVETVMAHEPGEVTLVPVGPLTNIAMAVRKEPRIVERVAEVVLMGGAMHTGNQSAVAEFNVHTDPEAAHVVFGAGWQVTMVGLDVTHQALADAAVMAEVERIGGPVGRLVTEAVESYKESYLARGFPAPPVHDPCAVAYVIDPSVLEVRRAPVSVELTGTVTRGMTVADLRGAPDESCPTQVAVGLDAQRFWGLVLEAMRRIDATL